MKYWILSTYKFPYISNDMKEELISIPVYQVVDPWTANNFMLNQFVSMCRCLY